MCNLFQLQSNFHKLPTCMRSACLVIFFPLRLLLFLLKLTEILYIRSKVSCLDGVIFDQDIKISHPNKLNFGKNIFIGSSVIFRCEGGISIADGTAIAANYYLISYYYRNLSKSTDIDKYSMDLQPISIGFNCLIGAYSAILPGVQLGDNVTVGAGSIVTKSFPDNVTVAGNPARIIKQNAL